MKKFVLSNQAVSDLRSIALFTQRNWGREQRNVYLKKMDHTFKLLGDNPQLGVTCDDVAKGYRKFPEGSHLIFYKCAEPLAKILVVRILHKAMDVQQHT